MIPKKSYRSPEVILGPDEGLDLFLDGRLKLIQSRDGYRFSIDAVLLSQFVTLRPGDVVIDLGTGCGVIPLILLLTKPVGHVFGLEIQAELITQAARNARLNGFLERMDVVRGDFRHPPFYPGFADLVVCNPPYRKINSGRINPHPQKAIARHEILASLDDLLQAAAALLTKKGRFALVYPAVRLAEVFVCMRRFHLEPKRVRIHYPDLESSAKLALIEATLGGQPGLEILPPLLGQGDFAIGGQP
ncbi:MAG: methyltransferase domain-containing protein [Deltaproteobacteria bacterium]|nr:methyltransferase domain-containing protein [Deltaproteobacteria bacterium]